MGDGPYRESTHAPHARRAVLLGNEPPPPSQTIEAVDYDDGFPVLFHRVPSSHDGLWPAPRDQRSVAELSISRAAVAWRGEDGQSGVVSPGEVSTFSPGPSGEIRITLKNGNVVTALQPRPSWFFPSWRVESVALEWLIARLERALPRCR